MTSQPLEKTILDTKREGDSRSEEHSKCISLIKSKKESEKQTPTGCRVEVPGQNMGTEAGLLLPYQGASPDRRFSAGKYKKYN